MRPPVLSRIFDLFKFDKRHFWHLLALKFITAGIVIVYTTLLLKPAEALDKVDAVVPETRTVIRGSGLPVPRFVSLKSDIVNMRVGPGHEYPLQWVYVLKNLPLKVISEFDVWRKVVDHEGETGWIHGQLVSLKRYGVITSSNAKLRAKPNQQATVTAVAEAGVLMELQYCERQWCRLGTDSVKGWLERSQFWGVLQNEELN
jgi:SH3-like domain-containing protein